jgi:hypothetical protein
MDPWADEQPRPPRTQWGCAIAAIVLGLAAVVAVIIMFHIANDVLTP